MQIKKGDAVIFTGQSVEQKNWGGHDDASHLVIGKDYIVESVDVHTWHTKITLKNVQGRFNSVCFEILNNSIIA
tara:strand:+ start:2549 stop:2770 length:222 start_codon:yes stop_codon:yes gene_type:complete